MRAGDGQPTGINAGAQGCSAAGQQRHERLNVERFITP
jgi:hypothetical protein